MGNRDLPLVSVAVITYNQKKFLKECIESILCQDYQNIEIVISDDASTDGTQEMLRGYEEQYPGKFVLKLAKDNQGITANSNVANFSCSGKYIAWMGGDDLMLPGKLSKQVRFMEKNLECAICYHDLDVFDNDTNKTLYLFSEKNKPREGDVRVSIKYSVFNGACSSMVRLNQTPKEGFNQLLPVASDRLYWVEVLASGGNISYIPEVLGRYRRHSGNVTNKKIGVSQNTVDHFNSCSFMLSKYPEYFSEIVYCYGILIRSERHNLPYFSSLITCFKLTSDIFSLGAIFIFCLTLGFVKI
ncbi:MAG: glycosyltransferase [Pseudomonadales bacterium]|nr:glycosyltransferase [Pseudomonadales bacterium]